MLAGATKGEKVSGVGGGGRVLLSDVNMGETAWIEVQVGMLFQIDSRDGLDVIREFVYDADGQAFLKMGLMGFDVDGYW